VVWRHRCANLLILFDLTAALVRFRATCEFNRRRALTVLSDPRRRLDLSARVWRGIQPHAR
jgi:hypothetical protein